MPQTMKYGPLGRHELDIYPARRKSGDKMAPVLVFLYGGSWKEGRKSLYGFLGKAFAAKGFCVVVPDYRLYPETRFPGFVEDAALALAWVKESIHQFGGDADQLHLMGHSAGAHIGALLCLDEGHLDQVDLTPSHLTSFTGVAGPYSFNPLESANVACVFEHLDDINSARPIKHAHGSAPPMLLLDSINDKTVPKHNSEHLHNALAEAGGRVSRITYPLPGHIGIIAAISLPLRFLAPVLRDSSSFMKAVDKQAPSEENIPRKSAL